MVGRTLWTVFIVFLNILPRQAQDREVPAEFGAAMGVLLPPLLEAQVCGCAKRHQQERNQYGVSKSHKFCSIQL
jgi:hypothetical protein